LATQANRPRSAVGNWGSAHVASNQAMKELLPVVGRVLLDGFREDRPREPIATDRRKLP
jgi:hypothetical protein